jgi:hypothetical protein
VLFPEEKILAEAATAAYLRQHTQLPVPKVFYHGVDFDIGPFMVIQDLGSGRGMGQALETPREDLNGTLVLNSSIPESKLKSLYVKIARCVQQLAQPTFPRIGGPRGNRPRNFHETGRPITLNMANMVQLSNIPSSVFPSKGTTYQAADKWYLMLANIQIATLLASVTI